MIDERDDTYMPILEEKSQIEPSVVDIIAECKNDFSKNVDKKDKKIIAQRASTRFWTVLFRQVFDLVQHNISVRFSGELGADEGGPYREFLRLCMERFSDTGGFFGSTSSLVPTAAPDKLQAKMYYILGQLSGVSILTIGRGPECIHPSVARAIFNIEDENVEDVDDARLKYMLEQIEKGYVSSMLDQNIQPSKNAEENKKLMRKSYVLYQRYAAIAQLRQGINSISDKFLEDICIIKFFVLQPPDKLTADQILSHIEYIREAEIGSNNAVLEDDSISEFEMALVEAEERHEAVAQHITDEDGFKLQHFLMFCTGCDRIPVTGFSQKIKVYFRHINTLPTVSTCGFVFHLPTVNTKKNINIAMKHYESFGSI